MFIYTMLPVEAWCKEKKAPDNYIFNVDVRDALTRRSIFGAQVNLSANIDSVNIQTAGRTHNDGISELTIASGADKYVFKIFYKSGGPQKQSLYEYETEYAEYSITNKYQKVHNVGPIYLRHKKHIDLDEVSVSASKVMFYYKGDTLIYNADAFVLAEGSMLDGLISQMPGVQLNRYGEITINGKKVDALLLNGKNIFNGNNQLMLENLAAYTVKDIAVYDKARFESKALGINAGSQYVMDVRLKRQFRHGFLGNAEAGYGSDSRYRTKLFGMWYSENGGMTAFLSSNNLNDDAKPKPGYSDGAWSDLSPSAGTGSYHSGGITYNAEGADSKWKVEGDAMARYSDGTVCRNQNTVVLIPANEMYQSSFSDVRDKDFQINSSHDLKLSLAKRAVVTLSPKVDYLRYRHESSDISAAFNKEIEGISRQIIENVYSCHQEFSQYLLNRTLVQSLERKNRFTFDVDGNSLIRLRPNDGRAMLTVGVAANVDNQRMKHYTYRRLDFTSRPEENASLLQYNDDSPYRDRIYQGYAKYTQSFNVFNLTLNVDYNYTRQEQIRNSQFYQASLLQDYLTPSVLPDLSTDLPLDPDESYRSRQWENRHSLNPSVSMRWNLKAKSRLGLVVNVPLILSQRTLDYHRGDHDQHISSTKLLPETNASLIFQTQRPGRYYLLSTEFKSSISQPLLLNMANVIDAIDPLNITLGNPDLADSRRNTVSLSLQVQGKAPHHALSMSYSTISNAISQGYYYISNTGQRLRRSYNVDGNRQANASYTVSWFKMDKSTLTNKFNCGYQRSRELIGAIVQSDDDFDITTAPQANQVEKVSVSDRFDISFNLGGKYNLKAFADLGLARYRSTQSSLANDVTFNGSYGLSAILNFPFNWGLSTDLTLFTRRGYLDNRLNTTDILWNGCLSKSFLKGSLVCAVEAYDILHQLSNIFYTVNAQYRTETITNVIPAYVLFSIQYRFNKQPKRN